MPVLTKTLDGIEKALQAMLDRGKQTSAYLNRTVYKQYQNAQTNRWITENASEGVPWKKLTSTAYISWKKKYYIGYPGAGEKMLIATGTLVKSVVGPGASSTFLRGGSQYHRKMVTERSITIGVSDDLEYAKYVAEVRPFMEFGKKTNSEIYSGLANFLVEGIVK